MSKTPEPIKGRCSNCGVTIWVSADGSRFLCDTCYRKHQDDLNRTGREEKDAYYPGQKKGW